MKRPVLAFLSAMLLLTFASSGLVAAPRWPHEGSDLPPDPAVTWGQLPNGLRYAIMRHEEPGEAGHPNRRVSLRLYVRVGSMMEQENERGLAHFLEHMAFNGTRHFPAGEVVKYLQRLGMEFGADTNAETRFDRTVYQLELPESSAAYLDDALTLFRDYADGMLLSQKEIDRERGVILSEKLARDSVGYRTLVENLRFLLPESLLPQRMPIGAEDVIRKATREQFEAFYRKWYTPDRMTVVIVGPVNPADAAARIAAKFGSMSAPARPVADPDWGKISAGRGLRVRLHTEMEARQTAITLEVARPYQLLPDTRQTQYDKFLRLLADLMLNNRLKKLTTGQDPPFLGASSSGQDSFRYIEENSLGIACKPEGWQRALATGEQELRRALKHGFTAAEFEEVKANVLALVDNSARQAGTRGSRDLADGIVKALTEGRVYTHPEEDRADVRAWFQKATPDQCAEALRKGWDSDDVTIFVHGNLALADGQRKIKDAFLQSRQVAVQPPAQEKRSAWAYASFGSAGRVAERRDVSDLGLTLVTFANNVRLTLKPTPFEKDTIRVAVNFGVGKLTAPKDKPGLIALANGAFIAGGLEKHSLDELNTLLAGKTAGAQFSVGDEFFTLSGATNRKDLALQLQVLCAYLTAPGYRDDRVPAFEQKMDSLYRAAEHDAGLASQFKLPGYLYNGDVRFAAPEKEQLKARTLAEVRQWMAEPLRNSWLEISIVGDFDPQSVIDAAAATFGALPARAAARPDYAAERVIPLVEPPRQKLIRFSSRIPKATVTVLWPIGDSRRDVAVARQSNVLASILGDRIREKVRQELGATYSPAVGSDTSDTFANKGAILCQLTAEARDAVRVSRIVTQLADRLAAEGATPDELARAKNPILKQVEDARRENGWWMSELADVQSNPQRLERIRTFTTGYEGVSLADVNRLARERLRQDEAIAVVVAPEDGPARVALRRIVRTR